MNSALKNTLQSLLFLLIGGVILFLLFRAQSAAYLEQCVLDGGLAQDCSLMDKLWYDFSQVKWSWILLVLGLFTLSNWSRSERWLILLEPLGYQPKKLNSFMAIMLGYFANLGIPRIGEVVRGGTLSRYENVPIEKSMGTIVMDRILDVISLLIILCLALLLEFDTIWGFLQENADLSKYLKLFNLTNILLVIVLGILLLLGLRYFFKKRKDNPIINKIKGFLLGFKDGIISIARVKRPGQLIFHSVLIWTLYYLMTFLCFKAFEPTAGLTAMAGLVTFVFGSLGMVVPLPGGMGSYHFCVMAALGLYGISGADSFSFAMIIFFSIQIFCNVLLGLLSLVFLPIYNAGQDA